MICHLNIMFEGYPRCGEQDFNWTLRVCETFDWVIININSPK